MGIVVRQGTNADLAAMAAVYIAAFPESIGHFFDQTDPPVTAVIDLLQVPLDAEPQAVLVAEKEGRIAGYCLAPAHFSRLAHTALHGGHLWRFVWRWITGRYNLGLRPLRMLALDKLRGHRERRTDPHHAEAHILSLAVHPDFQCQGIGKALLEGALAYLDNMGADPIRLEVRPANAAALHLYESHGFRTVGRTSDSQGEWLIMLRPSPVGRDVPPS